MKIDSREILGVVEDFHFRSMREAIKPFCFRLGLSPDDAMTITVKIKAGHTGQVVEDIRKFYTYYNPGFVFAYNFLDEDCIEQYASDKRIGVLSQYAAGVAIIISCLGLLALAAFSTERRTKEISIRKVLRSSELGILFLLSRDFTKVVFIAVVIALSVSYYLSVYWLSNFAYKINLKV